MRNTITVNKFTTTKDRNLHDVLEIIDKTKMTQNARNLAHKIFEIIAKAESKAHSKPVEEIHFHEVGAIDSIVDVIALSVCFDSLNVEKVFVPFLCEGTGTVRCQHGILPVPVPAVLNIVQDFSIPLKIIGDRGEFVTPTGAAFVAAVATDFCLPNNFVLKKIGMGAGKRDYIVANIVRAMLIETEKKDSENQFSSVLHDKIIKLETNIDDSTGETLGFVLEELFAFGAARRSISSVLYEKEPSGMAFSCTLQSRRCCENGKNHFYAHNNNRNQKGGNGENLP